MISPFPIALQAPDVDDHHDDLVRRTRAAMWFVIVGNTLFGIKDIVTVPPSIGLLLACKVVQLATMAAGLWALRSPTFQQHATAIGLAGYAVAMIMSAVSGAISGDYVTTPLLGIVMNLSAAALLPWGFGPQAGAAALAAGTVVVHAFLAGRFDYPIISAFVGLFASVVIAQQAEKQRAAEQRAVAAAHEREQFLRLIANGLPALIAYIDSDRRCRFANRAFEDWFGLARHLMHGQPIDEFIAPEALKRLEPHVAAALSGREVSFETVFTDRYGHSRTFALTYVPDTLANGAVRGFFSLANDITDRKQAEEAARQHQSQLAHALRLRTMGEMASAIAHELNQPLAAITTYATSCLNVAKKVPNSEPLQGQIAHIASEAMRCGEIIQRVRNFARRTEPNWEPANVNHLIEESVRLVDHEARTLGIEVHLHLAPTLPLVEVDAIQIEQVIINLLMNAFHAIAATRNQAREVSIETILQGSTEIEVAVRDSGVGLPAGIAKKIFEPYFTTRSEGLGMGLAISRSIVESHGGRMWATANPSAARGGATFRFTLPTARQAAAQREAS